MDIYTLALFGEAEKGEFHTAYLCRSLPQLAEYLGNPPPESKGLYYATQALLYNRKLIFIRVKDEGFSRQDYFTGLHLLRNPELISGLTAICIPGVGDTEIIEAIESFCIPHHTFLITNEADLYDYLTCGF